MGNFSQRTEMLLPDVGAENLCHHGRCLADNDRPGPALDVGRTGLGRLEVG